ncbi:DMT family transporter [Paenibacillus ihbetae]|uniref:EamA family transporter n=1 Tax=Paenibacillus ihbetae TaxID=1870820 RepID=A0ABX3JWP8_9BACL|nr:EamA family transporter [Paenibacillus ihbetae]OOC61838.1 EamA family transporter [Paenibacillus ihbetae]
MIIFNYLLMCAIFSTTFLVIKIGVEAGLPPFFSAGVRFLLAGALLFLWMYWKGKASLRLLLRKEFMLIGMTSTFMTFATLYWAEQHVDSGLAAILSATGPMMILIIQAVFLRKGSSPSDYIGCIVGFMGVCVLILPKLVLEHEGIWILSCILILIGEAAYAVGSLATRKLTFDLSDVSPITLNAVQMLYGGAALLLLSLFTEQMTLEQLSSWPAAGSVLYLMAVGSMLAHSLYAWLLKATNAYFPSTWLFISPMVALGLGALMYGEHLTKYSILGSMLVLFGIVLMQWRGIRSRLRARRYGTPSA